MQGIAERNIAGTVSSDLYAVKPVDFPGLIPKLDVRPGDSVDAAALSFTTSLSPDKIRFTCKRESGGGQQGRQKENT